jgi:hypothetical protein
MDVSVSRSCAGDIIPLIGMSSGTIVPLSCKETNPGMCHMPQWCVPAHLRWLLPFQPVTEDAFSLCACIRVCLSPEYTYHC